MTANSMIPMSRVTLGEPSTRAGITYLVLELLDDLVPMFQCPKSPCPGVLGQRPETDWSSTSHWTCYQPVLDRASGSYRVQDGWPLAISEPRRTRIHQCLIHCATRSSTSLDADKSVAFRDKPEGETQRFRADLCMVFGNFGELGIHGKHNINNLRGINTSVWSFDNHPG